MLTKGKKWKEKNKKKQESDREIKIGSKRRKIRKMLIDVWEKRK